jgi:nitrate/nitrite transporter NarK
MEWWILEIIVAVVMILIVVVLGPLIKRFGRGYAADVFRANPRTGKNYLVLMDIAYYLIFGSYVLFTVHFAPDTGWDDQVNANQLQASFVRIGGMLLLLGLLHGFNVLTLPVIGRLFSLNRQLDDPNLGDKSQLEAA